MSADDASPVDYGHLDSQFPDRLPEGPHPGSYLDQHQRTVYSRNVSPVTTPGHDDLDAARNRIFQRLSARQFPNRLLNTKDYTLNRTKEILKEEKQRDTVPSYAILSHTWLRSNNDQVTEVTLEDMQDSTRRKELEKSDDPKALGWAKLKGFCQRALQDGFDWAWMDTCCINKKDPVETQESINAMFDWYRNATICYAHLSDVDWNSPSSDHTGANILGQPLWFRRGWTLQEFLAPNFLLFVDKSWRNIGTRASQASAVERLMGISRHDVDNFRDCSIAKRLSWSSGRETTKVEDEAYCLLGLFGIQMPLQYGEGRKAFKRFQQELMKKFDDETLFAWRKGKDSNPGSALYYSGYLAPSVRCFSGLASLKMGTTPGFSESKYGLELKEREYWISQDTSGNRSYLIQLDCTDGNRPLAIVVHRTSQGTNYRKSYGSTLAIQSDQNPESWELYDNVLRSREPHIAIPEEPEARQSLIEQRWERQRRHQTFTIIPSEHYYDMPRVHLVSVFFKGSSIKPIIRPFVELKASEPDKQGLNKTAFSALDSKANPMMCFLLHDHLKFFKLRIEGDDSEAVKVVFRSPSPHQGSPNSPDYGFTTENITEGGWRNMSLEKEQKLSQHRISIDLFPVRLELNAGKLNNGEDSKRVLEKLKYVPRADFRAYHATIRIRRLETRQVTERHS